MRASHIKTFRGHGSFISSNLVSETHVPRNAPGTPQANARFRPARTHARSADEGEESGGDCAQRAGAGQKPLRGRPRPKQGGLGERALEGEQRRLGRSKGLGESQGGLGGRAGWRARGEREDPTSKTHRWPPDGQAARAGLCRFRGKDPRPPGNQRCDPADPAAVAEMPRPIRWDSAPSWSPHNPRTPACA
jgi:hypothetical protein